MRVALVLVLLSALALTGCLREFDDPHFVRIVGVDLRPANVLSQDVVLNVTSTLDNRGGGASGQLLIEAKAYDEGSGFLLAENRTPVGTLPGDTTRAVSMTVRVPRAGNVRIDVTIFEDEQGKERSSVSTRNLGALEPEVLDTGLRVRDMDFLVQDVSVDGANRTRAQIQADLYLTNEADAASEDLRIQVKAREITTSLVSDVQWIDTGSVPAGATLIRSTNLTVADGYNYAIEVLTWRGSVVVARNEDTVQLAPTFAKPKDQELVTTDPNVNDFLAGRGDGQQRAPTSFEDRGVSEPTVPGFGAAAALGAIALVVLVLRGRRTS